MAKETRTVERTETITLPPGTYYVGDPCFVIGDDNWAEFRKSFPARNTASMMDGHKSAVFGGFGGFGRDGPRRDDNGQTYQVESGLLAAIPQALITKTPPGLEDGWNGRMTTFYDQVRLPRGVRDHLRRSRLPPRPGNPHRRHHHPRLNTAGLNRTNANRRLHDLPHGEAEAPGPKPRTHRAGRGPRSTPSRRGRAHIRPTSGTGPKHPGTIVYMTFPA